MQSQLRRPRRHQHGSILLTALAFVAFTSMAMGGLITMAFSHYAVVRTEGDYARALTVAEAGINYELRRISQNTANADLSGPTGTSYTTSAGTFKVYITQRNADGTEPAWTAPNNLWVYSTGTFNGVSRTLKVGSRGYSNAVPPAYAVFAELTGSGNGGPAIESGDVGTNGTFSFVGHPAITGNVIFNGPGSGWSSTPGVSYNVITNPQPVVWPTVDTIANAQFPGTGGPKGVAWLATNNDNALAVPPIIGNSVTLHGNGSMTLKGKPGGANYYLTDLTCGGNAVVTFDNTAGPITIWQGPSGGSGTFTFHGGAAFIKGSADPTRLCRIYNDTTNTVTFGGNSEMDAGVYNVNSSNTASNSQVTMGGNPTIYGSVISNRFSFGGNPTVNYVPGLFYSTVSMDYYGAVSMVQEINGAD
jgi:Tfp pilus assembly protein PilX